MTGQVEYQGLWEEGKKEETHIYKVTEFYEWHNSDPEIYTNVFLDKGFAQTFYNQRVQEIPDEAWGYSEEDKKECVEIKEQWDGSLCIHNWNDYIHLSLEQDTINMTPLSNLWFDD